MHTPTLGRYLGTSPKDRYLPVPTATQGPLSQPDTTPPKAYQRERMVKVTSRCTIKIRWVESLAKYNDSGDWLNRTKP